MKAVIATIVAAVLCVSTPVFAQYEPIQLSCIIVNHIPETVKFQVCGKTVTLKPNESASIYLPEGRFLVVNQIIINNVVDSEFTYHWVVTKENRQLNAIRGTLGGALLSYLTKYINR